MSCGRFFSEVADFFPRWPIFFRGGRIFLEGGEKIGQALAVRLVGFVTGREELASMAGI